MKLSIFSPPRAGMTYKEVAAFAADHGIYGIEPYPMGELASMDTEIAKSTAEYALSRGVKVTCVSTGASLCGPDYKPEKIRLKKCIDMTAAFGAPYFHHTIIPEISLRFDPRPFSKLVAEAAERERELCEYAGKYGITVLNENQGLVFNGCERFDMYRDAIDCENWGVLLDVGNIFFVDETPEMFAGRFAPVIKHVHIKDYYWRDGTSNDPSPSWRMTRSGNYLETAQMGTGIVNFRKVFKILIMAGFDGFFSTEHGGKDVSEELLEGIETVRNIYDSELKSAAARGL